MPRGTQMINGVEYVFETKAKWNPDKKYGTHSRRYIGKMVDGVFVPNKRYQLEKELKEVKKPGPVPTRRSERLFCGATMLLDSIGEKLGIREDLEKCFPQDYKKILSLAYFLLLEDHSPLSRFPRWAMLHRHPYGKIISSPRSSELFAALDEDSQQRFFHLQMQRRMEHEYLAYDITSISSYSELIRFVKYGKNKEHDALPQINLALLYGESSRLPVYYRSLPGNISDVTTVKRLIDELGYLSIEKVKIILDRGFYSEDNINGLLSHHYKFLISVKTSLRLVQTMLDEVRESLPTRQYYNSNFRLYCTSRTIAWPYEERKARLGEVESGTRRMYLHLYYDDERAMEERTAFNILLDSLEAELKEGIRNPEHETLYQKYYEVTQTPVRGVTLNPKQEAIDKVERNYGYFGLLSNDIKNPLEALRIYRTKDLVEKAIANLKERLSARREGVSSESNLSGKLFVQFIALMYLSSIDKVMDDQGLYKSYTLTQLLDELDVIECYSYPGHTEKIGEMTKKQKELYEVFGVPLLA